MHIDHKSGVPVYQQLVDGYAREIHSGRLVAGSQLPTVRRLAQELDISKGTVKHAYDTLEQLGMIEKTQGRGSFVAGDKPQQAVSTKKQALELIDRMLEQTETLGFSVHDIRIFLDLKLREREQADRGLRVGVVDCSPEALGVLCAQVAALPGVDVYDFLLEDVLSAKGPFDPSVDIVITTPTHYVQLSEKMPPGHTLLQLVLAASPETVSQLARVPAGAKVGILCASARFAGVIKKACALYCAAEAPVAAQLLGDAAQTARLLDGVDTVILPPNHLRFCAADEREMLKQRLGGREIEYQYRVERGSLLYLRQEVEKMLHERGQSASRTSQK